MRGFSRTFPGRIRRTRRTDPGKPDVIGFDGTQFGPQRRSLVYAFPLKTL